MSRVSLLLLFAAWSSSPFQREGSTAYDKCRSITTAELRDSEAPDFAAYRVTVRPSSGKPRLNLKDDPPAQFYPATLREEISKGPNFAGYHRLASWSCGPSCAQFVLVNLKTGRVISLEPRSDLSYVHIAVDMKQLFPTTESDMPAFAFRRDSRLIVTLGAFADRENREGAFYYVLDADRLLLVHNTIVKKECEHLRR